MSTKCICNALFYGNIIWGCLALLWAATNPWWFIMAAINATVAWRLHTVLSRLDRIDKFVDSLTDTEVEAMDSLSDDELKVLINKRKKVDK